MPVKYLAISEEKLLAAISFNRATLKVGRRDRYIGWDDALKRQYLSRVVCNNRFLILPWVRVQNLASYLLSRTLRLLREDWHQLYGTSPFLVETFVDRPRYKGTCYKAAGWLELGETQGFAKAGKTYVYHGNVKIVFVKVLDKRFRKELGVTPDSRPLRTRKVQKRRGTTMMLSKPDYDPGILNACGITPDDVSVVTEMLQTYLSIYTPSYKRFTQKDLADTFIKGLLSDLDRKSIEPVALRYSGPKAVRTMQMFFKHSTFDDNKMLQIYQHELASLIGDEDGMLNIDGSDFPKKGENSVDVARQYCGILGKTENCQAGVFLGYAGANGYGLVDRRLYMPEKWFSDEYAELRKDCLFLKTWSFRQKMNWLSRCLTR